MSRGEKITIEIKSLSGADLTSLKGNHRRAKVGECFKAKDSDHYYLQKEENLLHVSRRNLINSLHNSCFDDYELEKISLTRFEGVLKETVFELEIYKYV